MDLEAVWASEIMTEVRIWKWLIQNEIYKIFFSTSISILKWNPRHILNPPDRSVRQQWRTSTVIWTPYQRWTLSGTWTQFQRRIWSATWHGCSAKERMHVKQAEQNLFAKVNWRKWRIRICENGFYLSGVDVFADDFINRVVGIVCRHSLGVGSAWSSLASIWASWSAESGVASRRSVMPLDP